MPALTFSPVIDGVELKEHPTVLAATGQFSNFVPLLLGSNENEGTLFNPLPANVTEDVVRRPGVECVTCDVCVACV